MKIDVLTLFPDMFSPVLNESILKRAQERTILEIAVHNIRVAATDTHNTVDDTPYGGGTGMVLKVDVIDKALQAVIQNKPLSSGGEGGQRPGEEDIKPHRILLTPQGERLNAKIVQELAQKPWLILTCGHYEGFDERIREHLTDQQISIGDYVLTGGELPAMVLIDAISRFVPGVLPEGAPQEDSFSLTKDDSPVLEYPHYTRPLEYNGWRVPDVLVSGNHAEIEKWRQNKSRHITK